MDDSESLVWELLGFLEQIQPLRSRFLAAIEKGVMEGKDPKMIVAGYKAYLTRRQHVRAEAYWFLDSLLIGVGEES